MLKDITLGQFFPGNSVFHKMDARTKLILTILYIVIVFLAKTIESFAAIMVFTGILIVCSRIPLKIILKGMKPLLFIMCFTFLFHIFFRTGEHLLVSFWKIHIYWEGIFYAVFMILRITVLLAGTCVILTYTTSPIALTDGLERLLSPLKKIRLPVHEFAMMMSIALRFIPTLMEETDKIMSAQKARGAAFDEGGLIKRAKALIPVLIPLFASSFRRAEELATAMECRCYHGGEGRTKMHTTHFAVRDYLALLLFVGMGVAVVCGDRFYFVYRVF